MKKRILTFTLVCVAALGLVGCKKKEEPEVIATTEEIVATTEEATTEDPHIGENYNELTGVWSKDYVVKRPVAVMINNIKEALPSASTKQADIIYECMVEGGITRLMALYSDYENLEKVGSVRSARHYYINIANEYNAIYVHVGQSKPAKKKLDKGAINNINGLTYDAGFYRDESRVAPHNCYTSGAGIMQGIKDFGYSTEYDPAHEKVLHFNEEETDIEGGEAANTVHVDFSPYAHPYFVYNPETKLYEYYSFNTPYVDQLEEEGKNALDFKNVIIMVSSYECINPDNDLQELVQKGEGKGYYCTNGKIIPIKWKKETKSSRSEFYLEDGTELLLNQGKSYISIIGDGENAGVTYE